MNTTPFIYKNIFLHASLQFCGNIEEYFSLYTEKLVVFIVMPRIDNKCNLIRLYKKGRLIYEEKFACSNNLILYYCLWYFHYIKALLRYFSPKEKVYIITFHPLSFFGRKIIKFLRDVEFVYWIGDYFPPTNLLLVSFEKLKKYYHDSCKYSCYLSDKINEKFNGRILNNKAHKTVMWGVNPKNIKRSNPKDNFTILFVGLVKESQGLNLVFNFLKDHRDYKLKIIGICEKKLYKKYQRMLVENNLLKRVYFPNKFASDDELVEQSKDCHVGIALYDINPNNATNFADPGKIKAYAEMQLPVIMSNISDIANFVKRYKSGEVIEHIDDLLGALKTIRKDYIYYQEGLRNFNNYFYFKDYYRKAFTFMEHL